MFYALIYATRCHNWHYQEIKICHFGVKLPLLATLAKSKSKWIWANRQSEVNNIFVAVDYSSSYRFECTKWKDQGYLRKPRPYWGMHWPHLSAYIVYCTVVKSCDGTLLIIPAFFTTTTTTISALLWNWFLESFFNKMGFVISKKDFDLQVKSMLYNTV